MILRPEGPCLVGPLVFSMDDEVIVGQIRRRRGVRTTEASRHETFRTSVLASAGTIRLWPEEKGQRRPT